MQNEALDAAEGTAETIRIKAHRVLDKAADETAAGGFYPRVLEPAVVAMVLSGAYLMWAISVTFGLLSQ